MHKFYLLKITHIEKETPNAVSIHFEVPTDLKDIFSFEAGQYLTLKTTVGANEVRRAYSLCSTPHSNTLVVVVKSVKDGAFSVFANTQLQVNDMLEVMPPEGKFIFQPNAANKNTYAAFASGSGITPILSILKTVLEKEPESSFLLVYGNQNPQETIFKKHLHDLHLQYPNRFFLEFVYSRAHEDGSQFGRISTPIINYFLKNKYKHLALHAFYLCGPEEMIEETKGLLLQNNVPEGAIHYELFTTSVKEKTLDIADGNTSITVTLDDETSTFIMPRSKSVLDAVLAQDLDAPYSCQGGICSTCIARVKEGHAEMRKNQILTESEIAEGLILTCQAHPTTSVFNVDYDDV